MNKCIIIAEAGVNHNGNLEMAREMVRVARECGADYVKFQTAVPELVISSIAPKAEYQEETTGKEESQLEMCRAIPLPLSDYAGLAELFFTRLIARLAYELEEVVIQLLSLLEGAVIPFRCIL